MSDLKDERDWLDEALAAWPGAVRAGDELDAAAAEVERRIAAGERGASAAYMSDEKIFASPVGQSPEESHNNAASSAAHSSTTSAAPASRGARGKSEESMSMSSDRERDRRSLQELAKLANATPAPSSVKFDVGPLSAPLSSSSRKDEDSGLVDLKAFAPAPEPAPVSAPPPSVAPVSAPPASAGPSSVAPVSAGPSSTDAAVVSAAAPSAGPASAAAPVAVAAVATAPAAQKDSGKGKLLVLGGLFAAAAIAAGAFFATRTPKPEEPVAMNTPVETKAPEKPAAAVVAPTPAPEATEAPAEPAAAAPKPAVAAVKASAGAAKAEPKEEKKEEKKVTAADLPASGGAAGDLGAAMRQAAGPGAQTTQEEKPSGPQFAAGSVPQKPSQGAVTGALGAVLGAARACLQPDDPVSRATVTFASAGNVTSVSVSGGAAGKPAEGCIKSALMKAKVSPFAQATYSTPVTIRH